VISLGIDLPQLISTIQALSGDLVSKYGAWGVAAAMLIESVGVPFASTVVLLTAGSMILSGRAGFWLLLLASTAGIILGSVISYILGYLGGSIGRVVGNRFFNRRPKEPAPGRSAAFSKVYPFIEKYGTYSIFAGQLWGVTRTFISFPAGVLHMNLLLFIVYTTLGGAIFSLWVIGWSVIFTRAAGLLFRLLGILNSLSPWIWLALVFVVAAFIYLFRRMGWKLSLPSFLNRLKR